jgi:hypothetical protein
MREANFTGRPSTTWGTALTSDAVAHTEPATETELIASTSFDTHWVNIWFHTNSASGTNSDSLVNIKVGGAGSEQTIIQNLMAGWAFDWATGGGACKRFGFPIRIPAGSRVSATHRSVRTSTAVRCCIELLGGDPTSHWVGTGVECVGAVTGSSRGTTITAGTTVEGTLTSIGTNTYEWGFVDVAQMGNADTTLTAQVLSADLADGPATTDLIPGLADFLDSTNANEYSSPLSNGRYCLVPAGTTLYARTQTSGTAEARSLCIYGVY